MLPAAESMSLGACDEAKAAAALDFANDQFELRRNLAELGTPARTLSTEEREEMELRRRKKKEERDKEREHNIAVEAQDAALQAALAKRRTTLEALEKQEEEPQRKAPAFEETGGKGLGLKQAQGEDPRCKKRPLPMPAAASKSTTSARPLEQQQPEAKRARCEEAAQDEFDGKWSLSGGRIVTIAKGKLTGFPSDWTFRKTGEYTCELVQTGWVFSYTYTGTINPQWSPNRIEWSDGDVWMKKASSATGGNNSADEVEERRGRIRSFCVIA